MTAVSVKGKKTGGPASTRKRIRTGVHPGQFFLIFAGSGMLLPLLVSDIPVPLRVICYAFVCFPFIAILSSRFASRLLSVGQVVCEDSFAGSSCDMEITVRNTGTRYCGDVRVSQGKESATADIDALSDLVFRLPVRAEVRGVYPFPELTVSTTYPFGLVRAGYRHTPAGEYFVYPPPEKGAPPLPPHVTVPARVRLGEEVEGLRDYRHGDPMAGIDWKVSARRGELAVREYSDQVSSGMMVSSSDVAGMEREAGLSRLCAWVLMAHGTGKPFGLEMGNRSSGFGKGIRHRDACLRMLAEVPFR